MDLGLVEYLDYVAIFPCRPLRIMTNMYENHGRGQAALPLPRWAGGDKSKRKKKKEGDPYLTLLLILPISQPARSWNIASVRKHEVCTVRASTTKRSPFCFAIRGAHLSHRDSAIHLERTDWDTVQFWWRHSLSMELTLQRI